jgi:hypothetical protein
MFFKKINCKYYFEGNCFYIPKYINPTIGINQQCTFDYEVLNKKDIKGLVKKCAIRNTIEILKKRDKELKKTKD